MTPLTDMSTADLQYLRQKFSTEVKELEDEISRRQTRLTTRLDRQAQDATAIAELETALAEAEAVVTELQTLGASATSIATAQTVVDDRQAELNGHSTSSSYVSDKEAQLIQMELDEMEQGRVLRNARIGDIDAILGS